MKKENVHTEQGDFFDYLAEKEIDKITDADMHELFGRIDARTGTTSAPATNYFSVVLITAFSCLLFMLIFSKKNIIQIGGSLQEPQAKPADLIADAVSLDTIFTIAENTDAKKIRPGHDEKNKTADHFTISERDRHFAETIEIEILPTKEITSIDTAASKPALTENMLRMLPNASVLYIYDLKITEFQKLYFKKMKPFVLNETGLSSAYENNDAYKSLINEQRNADYTLDMLLKDALKAFNKKQFKLSFALFEEILEYNKQDVNALFYSGLCQYENGYYADALNRFDKVILNENNVFDQEAEWYKALSLLEQDKSQEAVSLLAKISSENGFYAERAGNKLKDLKKSK